MRRKVLTSLFVIALAAAVIGGATMAWFWDTDETGTQQFTAGTLLIDIDEFELATTDVDLDILNPGDEWEYDITIKNIGNKTFNWKVIFCWDDRIGQANLFTQDQDMVDALIAKGYGTDPLSDVLEFKIDLVNEDGTFISTILEKQTLENKSSPLKFDSPVEIDPGEEAYFKLYAEFPEGAGNEYQGSKMQAGFVVLAWQTTNDAPQPDFEEDDCPFDFFPDPDPDEPNNNQ